MALEWGPFPFKVATKITSAL